MKNFLLFSLFLMSCERDLPTAPTIINGLVIDENDKPVPNMMFQFSGYDNIGAFRGEYATFVLQEVSDENGLFQFSQVVSKSTDRLSFLLIGIVNDSTGYPEPKSDFDYYDFYVDDLEVSSNWQDRSIKNDEMNIWRSSETKILGRETNLTVRIGKL